jgi:MFS transporter, SHS family, lactate transporter
MADVSPTADEKVVPTGNGEDALYESHDPDVVSPTEYALTRFSSLKPPMHKAPNPIRLVMMLNTKQWLFFLVGFIAWVRRAPSPLLLHESSC